jgi:hypothetical protein
MPGRGGFPVFYLHASGYEAILHRYAHTKAKVCMEQYSADVDLWN